MNPYSYSNTAVGLDKIILPNHFQVWQRHHPVLFTAFEFGGWIRFRELSSIFDSLIDFGWTLLFQVNAPVQNLKIPFQLITNQVNASCVAFHPCWTLASLMQLGETNVIASSWKMKPEPIFTRTRGMIWMVLVFPSYLTTLQWLSSTPICRIQTKSFFQAACHETGFHEHPHGRVRMVRANYRRKVWQPKQGYSARDIY